MSILASLSLVTALACGGLAGCGSSNSTSPNGEDGGEGGTGEGGDAQEEMSPTPDGGMDAPKDSPSMQDSPSTQDSPVDSPVDSPKDSPGDAPMGDGCSGAVAQFSTSTINEGAGNCGASAGVTQTFSIKNTGCSNLTVTASTGSSTVFSATPTTLTVAAGMTGTITIKAVVPASSTAGTALSGSMALTTNDPAHANATIPLSVMPTGATLAWATSSPTSASFGTQPEGVAATPISLTLDNTGNASAMVTFATPSNAQFSLSPASATIAAAGNSTLTAGFTPNTTTASTATSNFTVTGAICGTSVSSLSFSGQGGTGQVTGWPTTAIDFGGGDCGGSAPGNKTFTLTNSGTLAAHITAVTFGGSAGYSSSAGVGATIPAMGTLVVTLTPPAVPFPSPVPGNFGATVTYTTDIVGDTPHQVDLTEHAVGAILAWDNLNNANFGQFGAIPAGTTSTENFAVKNTGNASSSVTLAVNSPFGVSTASFSVAGAASQPEAASFAPPAFGSYTSSLSMSGTALCQAVPAPLTLNGSGNAGQIGVKPGTISFSTNCGSAAGPQSITISNTGNQPFNWNAALATTTWYGIAPSSGNLAAMSTTTITVTPVAIPAGSTSPSIDPATYADTVTITTDIVNDTPHTVSLSEVPLGDVLTVKPTSMDFGKIPINTTSPPQTFVVENAANTGTPTANVTVTSSNGTVFPVNGAATINTTAQAKSQSAPISVTFVAPGSPNTYTSKIDLTTGDVLCAPLPTSPALATTGQATEAGPVGIPGSIAFGKVDCSKQATAKTFTVTNNGTQAFQITALNLHVGTNYTVTPSSPLPATVNPGAGCATNCSVTITVTPGAIPATVSAGNLGNFGDSLTVTTNANIPQPVYNVTLTENAYGVIVDNNLASATWAFGTVNYGSTGYFNVGIHNSGNAPLQAQLQGLTQDVFGLNGPSSGANSTIITETSAPGSMTVPGSFTPSAPTGSWADSAVLVIVPSTSAADDYGNAAGLCEPLPNSWNNPTITLTGSASNNPTITISGTLAFPSPTCGGTNPAAQNVTIQNTGNAAVPYTATLDFGTYYTIVSASPSPIQPNTTATVSVQPNVTLTNTSPGSSQYSDDLVLTVNGTQYLVPISMTVNGALLGYTNALANPITGAVDAAGDPGMWTYNYFADNVGFNDYNAITVQNSGNAAATVTGGFSGFSAGNFSWTGSSSAIVNPNSSQNFTFTYDGTEYGTQCYTEGFVGFTASNLCQPASTELLVGISNATYFGPACTP